MLDVFPKTSRGDSNSMTTVAGIGSSAAFFLVFFGIGSSDAQAGVGDLQDPEEQSAPSMPGRNPGPEMTRQQALELIGKPLDITVFTDAQGREIEDWIYPSGEWLRFMDGKLKSAGTLEWTPRVPEMPAEVHSM
jgi:hypothetical protein